MVEESPANRTATFRRQRSPWTADNLRKKKCLASPECHEALSEEDVVEEEAEGQADDEEMSEQQVQLLACMTKLNVDTPQDGLDQPLSRMASASDAANTRRRFRGSRSNPVPSLFSFSARLSSCPVNPCGQPGSLETCQDENAPPAAKPCNQQNVGACGSKDSAAHQTHNALAPSASSSCVLAARDGNQQVQRSAARSPKAKSHAAIPRPPPHDSSQPAVTDSAEALGGYGTHRAPTAEVGGKALAAQGPSPAPTAAAPHPTPEHGPPHSLVAACGIAAFGVPAALRLCFSGWANSTLEPAPSLLASSSSSAAAASGGQRLHASRSVPAHAPAAAAPAAAGWVTGPLATGAAPPGHHVGASGGGGRGSPRAGGGAGLDGGRAAGASQRRMSTDSPNALVDSAEELELRCLACPPAQTGAAASGPPAPPNPRDDVAGVCGSTVAQEPSSELRPQGPPLTTTPLEASGRWHVQHEGAGGDGCAGEGEEEFWLRTSTAGPDPDDPSSAGKFSAALLRRLQREAEREELGLGVHPHLAWLQGSGGSAPCIDIPSGSHANRLNGSGSMEPSPLPRVSSRLRRLRATPPAKTHAMHASNGTSNNSGSQAATPSSLGTRSRSAGVTPGGTVGRRLRRRSHMMDAGDGDPGFILHLTEGDDDDLLEQAEGARGPGQRRGQQGGGGPRCLEVEELVMQDAAAEPCARGAQAGQGLPRGGGGGAHRLGSSSTAGHTPGKRGHAGGARQGRAAGCAPPRSPLANSSASLTLTLPPLHGAAGGALALSGRTGSGLQSSCAGAPYGMSQSFTYGCGVALSAAHLEGRHAQQAAGAGAGPGPSAWPGGSSWNACALTSSESAGGWGVFSAVPPCAPHLGPGGGGSEPCSGAVARGLEPSLPLALPGQQAGHQGAAHAQARAACSFELHRSPPRGRWGATPAGPARPQSFPCAGGLRGGASGHEEFLSGLMDYDDDGVDYETPPHTPLRGPTSADRDLADHPDQPGRDDAAHTHRRAHAAAAPLRSSGPSSSGAAGKALQMQHARSALLTDSVPDAAGSPRVCRAARGTGPNGGGQGRVAVEPRDDEACWSAEEHLGWGGGAFGGGRGSGAAGRERGVSFMLAAGDRPPRPLSAAESLLGVDVLGHDQDGSLLLHGGRHEAECGGGGDPMLAGGCAALAAEHLATTRQFNEQINKAADCSECGVAYRLWHEMSERGVQPDVHTLNGLLRCLSRSEPDPDRAEELLRDLCDAGAFSPNATTLRLMDEICCRFEQLSAWGQHGEEEDEE